LTIDPQRINHEDPIRSLDVSLLQDLVLAPLLGVADPRTDKRVDFVGGIRADGELERRVRSGEMALGYRCIPPRSISCSPWLMREQSCRPRAPGSSPS
jgi:uncharacterized protein (DUF1015 family)